MGLSHLTSYLLLGTPEYLQAQPLHSIQKKARAPKETVSCWGHSLLEITEDGAEAELQTLLILTPVPYAVAAEKNQTGISFWEEKSHKIIPHWSDGMALHYIILFKLIWANKYQCVCVCLLS